MSEKSRKAFKRKLKELTRKTIPISFAERIRRLNRLIRGWLNYFKLANIHGKLKAMDSWLRKRLRYCIWSRKLSGEETGTQTEKPDASWCAPGRRLCMEPRQLSGWKAGESLKAPSSKRPSP
ncbi:MAG: group II intron maturase-specific domain-containing protein [Balneolaceae bacterium]